MTGNPRAMDIASTVLGSLTPEIRANIRNKGAEFLEKLNKLKDELGGLVTKVQGTGLLFSFCELDPSFQMLRHQLDRRIHARTRHRRYSRRCQFFTLLRRISTLPRPKSI